MSTEEIIQSQYQELCRVVEASKADIALVAQMADVILEALQSGGKVLTAGNGGSAADALHMAEELVGRYRGNRRSLPAISLAADVTALTCIANDFGYDAVFARQIEGLGQEGDVFVGYSTSGNSGNIIEAVKAAKAKGLKVLLFLGKTGGKLKGQGDLEWIVPHSDSGRIQEMHGWSMHGILEVVEQAYPIEE